MKFSFLSEFFLNVVNFFFQSFYIDGTPIMSNEEFDNLKEELIWAGSSVAILSK